MPDGPLVDYEARAGTYDRARRPSGAASATWRQAVGRHLPADGHLHVVADVGCGTGFFLAMWVDLGAGAVVGVEPAAAMRARAAPRCPPRARLVAGTCAELPLADASVDVAWLSAVVHHVGDLDVAAAELARVLRPGGRVLLRGFVPGHSDLPWLATLPRPERLAERFPTLEVLGAALGRAGVDVLGAEAVPEADRPTGGAAAAWVEEVRHADSILTAFDDDEVAGAVAALRARGDERVEPMALTLVVAERR